MATVTETTAKVKTPRKPRKPAGPVSGVCKWLIHPLAVKDFESGVLAISGTEYLVTLPADRSGARLTKADGEKEVYHVDLARPSCDCPDAQFTPRPGGCKHYRAVSAAVAVLPRAKYTVCPRCQAYCDGGQVCDQCQAEDDYYTACDQMAAEEAAAEEVFGQYDVA